MVVIPLMTTDPVRSLSFRQLREELEALPPATVGETQAGVRDPRDERRRVLEGELRRRDHAPIPLASAGLDEAPTDPNKPTSSA